MSAARNSLARRLCVVAVATALAGLAMPGIASAAYAWDFGAVDDFAGSLSNLDVVTVRNLEVLQLERRIAWDLKPNSVFDPRTATRVTTGVGAGDTLVADGNGIAVNEYSPSGAIVWSYTTKDDPKLSRPFSAQRLPNENTLICDRTSYRVIEVTRDKKIVWQYGTGSPGTGPGQLADPFSAVRVGSNTLICDNKDAYRVIEVTPAKQIKWKYGNGVSGVAGGQIASPRQAERLANGNTLIADEWGQRVIEVTPSGAVTWSFGVSGVQGSDSTHLNAPCYATRLADGRTLICDKDNRRLLWVDEDGTIDSSYGLGPATPSGGQLVEARTSALLASGNVLIADNAAHRVFEIAYVSGGRYETRDMDLGMPGIKKWLTSITTVREIPSSTSIRVSYSLDGGAWKSLGSNSTATFPASASARFVRMRFDFSTGFGANSPSFRTAQIAYDLTKPASPPPPNGGRSGGSTTPPTTGGSSQSGSSSQRRYAWSWGNLGVVPGAGSASGAASGDSGTGAASLGDLALQGGSTTVSGAQLTGWLLKEINPGPAEGGATSGTSGSSAGTGAGGAGTVGAQAAAEITHRTGRTASLVTLVTLLMVYAAGTVSGTLSNAALRRKNGAATGLEA